MVAHAYNPSTLKAEAGGLLETEASLCLCMETLSQNQSSIEASTEGRGLLVPCWSPGEGDASLAGMEGACGWGEVKEAHQRRDLAASQRLLSQDSRG